MKILSIIIIGLLVTNCSNSYVKNKKTITSPDDLQKFVNVYCDKNKSTNKVIKVCGNDWSKDLNISENNMSIIYHGADLDTFKPGKPNRKLLGLPEDKKLNFDIWLDKKTSVIVKVTYKKMGDWEYRLKNLE